MVHLGGRAQSSMPVVRIPDKTATTTSDSVAVSLTTSMPPCPSRANAGLFGHLVHSTSILMPP
jgi:hypothetical protein